MQFAEIRRGSRDALPFMLINVGESEKQPPVVRPEGFEWHHFIWVKAGVGEFMIRDQSLTVEEGHGLFLRADVPHSYRGSPFYTRWCTFWANETILREAVGEREYLPFACPPYMDAETDSLIRAANSSGSLLARSAAGYAYAVELFLTITRTDIPTEIRATEYLETHYADPLTLDDIASAIGTDKFALCHAFREKRSTTVMEHLNEIRIAKAKRYLRYGADSIAAVGAMCGFASASYFIKRFRERCGCTPREYRERYRYK